MLKIKRQTIKLHPPGCATISWRADSIVDWAVLGTCYGLDGQVTSLGPYALGYPFDRGLTSKDGRYGFVCVKDGTKGLLLKDGNVIREINRSYYQATRTEYPAAFYTNADGITYLIHCPSAYNRLDFEEVETGKIVTDVPGRILKDIFHSRLEISPDNRSLMVRGWVWQPCDVIQIFDIDACLADPKKLDDGLDISDGPMELSVGAFIDGTSILVGSREPDENIPDNHVAVWNFKEQTLGSAVKVSQPIGNIVGVRDNIAWDFYKHPKIFDIRTGEVIDKLSDVNTGEQVSSVIHHSEYLPQIIYNRDLNKVAVTSTANQIDVFSIE